MPPGVPDPTVWGDRDAAAPEPRAGRGGGVGRRRAYAAAADVSRHGSIRLIEPACTSCMVCARECPTWCITIDSHSEVVAADQPGARPRTTHVLDRFAIDWSLCMYCGICIDECPFDALEWAGGLCARRPGSAPGAGDLR